MACQNGCCTAKRGTTENELKSGNVALPIRITKNHIRGHYYTFKAMDQWIQLAMNKYRIHCVYHFLMLTFSQCFQRGQMILSKWINSLGFTWCKHHTSKSIILLWTGSFPHFHGFWNVLNNDLMETFMCQFHMAEINANTHNTLLSTTIAVPFLHKHGTTHHRL